MKITGPILKQSLTKALDWFDKQCFQVQGSLEAGSLCDNFEKMARRVPRNICADPAVEAKRAVSNSTKHGLAAFEKSIINCLNEADDAYMQEFARALQVFAAEYLELQLSCIAGCDEHQRRFQISLMSENDTSRIRIRALRSLDQANSAFAEKSLVPGAPGKVRAATDEDFAVLMARAS